jgi:hypothetical protein
VFSGFLTLNGGDAASAAETLKYFEGSDACASALARTPLLADLR